MDGVICYNYTAPCDIRMRHENEVLVKLYEQGRSEVKCTLVQALRLCTGRTAHSGSRGIALLFHDHGTRRRWGVSVTPRPLFTPGTNPVPIVQEAVWPQCSSGQVRKISPPPRFDPRTVQSLYRLRYPAQEKRSPWEGGGGRTFPSVTLCTTNPTRKVLELSGERPASNIHSYGMTSRKTIIRAHTTGTSFYKSNSLVHNKFQKLREQQAA